MTSVCTLLLCCLVLAGVAAADPCVDYDQYAHTTTTMTALGYASAVAVAPGRAYLVANGGLQVLDVSVPDSPGLLGLVEIPGAKDVALAGGFVLVTDGGLQVVDVTNDASPVIVGTVSGFNASVIATRGSIAFVATSTGVTVIDCSVPSAPQILTTLPSSYQGAPVPIPMQDVTVVGSSLYALSFDMQIFDITNPASPVLLGTYTPSASEIRLAVVGNVAYIGGTGPTKIVDVSNPAAPTLVSTLDLGFWKDLVVSGTHAFVGYSSESMAIKVLDVTDPAAPHQVGAVPTKTGHLGLAISGDRLFAVGGNVGANGMSVVDIQPAFSPPPGHVDTPDNAQGVALVGTHAYVADGTSLQVVDVSDRLAPIIVGDVAVEANVVAAAGSLAIVGGASTTHVIDISDPTAPGILGSLAGGAMDLELVGSRAFRADGNLDIIDVSNPAAPLVLGSSTTNAERVEIDGPYAYTARVLGNSISVLDISGNIPALVGTSVGGEYCLGFAHEGQNVFCVDPTHSYIWVHDVANPASPFLKDSIRLQGGFAAATGNGLYVMVGNGELWAIPEIPDPQASSFAAFGAVAAPIGYGAAIESGGGLVLVPAGTNGLYVLPAHCETPTSVVEESAAMRGLLLEAWPTPARGPLSLRFALPRSGAVRLRVYDVAGRRLRDLVQSWYPAGLHVAGWDGRDDHGRQVGSGVYQVLMTTSAGTSSKSVVIIR